MVTGMKKAVSVLLTVVLAASFAACKKEKQHSAKDDPSTAIASEAAGSSVFGQSGTGSETRSEPQAEPEPDTNPVPQEWRYRCLSDSADISPGGICSVPAPF